ncbi:MAG: hypothetical protein CMA65_00850 [Euryarchaeota archaeon]|nr:hypothetical protein [Euryarchaeota archaeon]
MEEQIRPNDDWPLGTILWFAVLVWFSSSLLSQTAYLAIYGLPYDATALLKTLGPVYYFVLVLELVIWVGLFSVGGYRFYKSRQTRNSIQRISVAGQ